MDNRQPTGVLLVMVNNTEPSKDVDFNDWYNNVHIPDVLGTGSYYHATRYENTDPKPGEARFVAIYETDWKDPDEAFKGMRKYSGDMDIWPHLEAVFVQTFKLANVGSSPAVLGEENEGTD